MTRDEIRQSRDEELVADTLAYILLDPKPPSNTPVLNEYFGVTTTAEGKERYESIERAVAIKGEDNLYKWFIFTYELLVKGLDGQSLNGLIFQAGRPSRMPRYFQAIFLALYELVIERQKAYKSESLFSKKLSGLATKVPISEGGKWNAIGRQETVDSVIGMLRRVFEKSGTRSDIAYQSWSHMLENIFRQSRTEKGVDRSLSRVAN